MQPVARVIGLDVGDRRIGVAVSDALGLSAQPSPTVTRRGLAEDVKAIEQVVVASEAVEVVVGLPMMLNGTLGPQAKKVLAFAEALKARLSIPVTTWDERFTTCEAERVLLEADMSRAKRKTVVDRVAAVLILQGYLASRSLRAE